MFIGRLSYIEKSRQMKTNIDFISQTMLLIFGALSINNTYYFTFIYTMSVPGLNIASSKSFSIISHFKFIVAEMNVTFIQCAGRSVSMRL